MPFQHFACLGLLIILYSGSCAAKAEDESEADSEHARVKRSGWSMFRLGRGLQMLRLGKRGGLPMMRMGRDSGDDSAFSPEELRFLLSLMVDESKTLSSRQIPLPRYGKDLDLQTAYEKGLGNDDTDKVYRRSTGAIDDEELPHLRPAPRGGRLRRSALSQFTRLSEKLRELQNRERAVALPRIGRFSKERAVPIPRIG